MKNTSFNIKPFLGLLAIAIFSSFTISSTHGTLLSWQLFMVFISVILALLSLSHFIKMKATYFIMGSGIFLRLCYILYTEVWERQHDVVDFGAGEGQAAYIEYFLEHNTLPDFDPRSVWGFFQPPLHHIISALWMRINLRLGIALQQARENVQALTFFYMAAMIIIVYFITKELEMQKWGTIITMIVVSLHPMYILLSGSINNDALSLFLTVVAMYLAICWYKRGQIITLILLALSIGCGMFAKLSGYMIAPAVAVLFIIKLVEEKGHRFRLILQYLLFAVICVPIGLFWTVRNMLLYNMPINYIPPVGGQFNVTMMQRLFDYRMTSVFPAMIENGDAYYEYNVFLALIKTSLFGEYNYSNYNGFFTPFCTALFIVGAFLALVAFIATVIIVFTDKAAISKTLKVFLAITYVTVLGSFLAFALSYSNFSAQDFRYGGLAVVVQAIMLGLYADINHKGTAQKDSPSTMRRSKFILSVLIGATAIFGVCSFIVYCMLGFVK